MDPMFCTCKNWSGGRQWRIGWLIKMSEFVVELTASYYFKPSLDYRHLIKLYLWIQKDQLCWGSRTSSFGHWQTCRTVNSPFFVATQGGYKVLCNISIKEPRNTGFPERMIDYFFSFSEGQHSSLQWTGTFLFHFFRGVPSYIKYFFIWASIMPVHQVKWWFWCVHFHWAALTAEFLETFAGS